MEKQGDESPYYTNLLIIPAFKQSIKSIVIYHWLDINKAVALPIPLKQYEILNCMLNLIE